MAHATGSAKDSSVHSADKANVITPDDIGNLDVERRDQYLKRLKRENDQGKKAFKKTEEHYLEVEGKKVLRRQVNASGSVYTHYFFSRTKYPEIYATIERTGGFEFVDPVNKKSMFLPLKTVNGKPFSIEKKGRR